MERNETHFTIEDFSEAYPPGVEDTYWHLARNRIIEGQIRDCGKDGPRVLDIGCGRGILISHLVKRGIDAYGVDQENVASTNLLHGRTFSQMSAEELPEDFRKSVDVIVLGDVIEHLPEPQQFLASIRKSFENAGTFVITVPARQEIWSNYDTRYRHYRRYDLQLLRETVESVGLKTLELRYFFRPLYCAARVQLALVRSRSTKVNGPGRLRWLHSLLAQMMLAEYQLLPAGMHGTSAICRATVVR